MSGQESSNWRPPTIDEMVAWDTEIDDIEVLARQALTQLVEASRVLQGSPAYASAVSSFLARELYGPSGDEDQEPSKSLPEDTQAIFTALKLIRAAISGVTGIRDSDFFDTPRT